MQSETVIAVLTTIVVLGFSVAIAISVRSALRTREEQKKHQNEINRQTLETLQELRRAMGETGDLVAQNFRATADLMVSNFNKLHDSIDPEVSKKFSAAVDRLSEVISKHGSDIERFGDAGLLMSSYCRKMNDNITALRTIVYGGKRAEDFSFTTDDPESVRRADMENDVMMLMQDHGMPRAEAERRVKQQFSTRPIG